VIVRDTSARINWSIMHTRRRRCAAPGSVNRYEPSAVLFCLFLCFFFRDASRAREKRRRRARSSSHEKTPNPKSILIKSLLAYFLMNHNNGDGENRTQQISRERRAIEKSPNIIMIYARTAALVQKAPARKKPLPSRPGLINSFTIIHSDQPADRGWNSSSSCESGRIAERGNSTFPSRSINKHGQPTRIINHEAQLIGFGSSDNVGSSISIFAQMSKPKTAPRSESIKS
jgi:hypothetical protein